MKNRLLLCSVALIGFGLGGCANIHRQMLHTAIGEFAKPIAENAPERIWLTPKSDTCTEGSSSGVAKRGFFGRLFGKGGNSATLAQEVFTNFLTQAKRGRVIEPHRANYFTSKEISTRLYVTHDVKKGKETVEKVAIGTFEDPCILDEAKKRSADKVLSYDILKLAKDELEIHLRLSDVKTAVVEQSRTLWVQGTKVQDIPTR